MFLVLEVLVLLDLLTVVVKSSESGPGGSRVGGVFPLDVMGDLQSWV